MSKEVESSSPISHSRVSKIIASGKKTCLQDYTMETCLEFPASEYSSQTSLTVRINHLFISSCYLNQGNTLTRTRKANLLFNKILRQWKQPVTVLFLALLLVKTAGPPITTCFVKVSLCLGPLVSEEEAVMTLKLSGERILQLKWV